MCAHRAIAPRKSGHTLSPINENPRAVFLRFGDVWVSGTPVSEAAIHNVVRPGQVWKAFHVVTTSPWCLVNAHAKRLADSFGVRLPLFCFPWFCLFQLHLNFAGRASPASGVHSCYTDKCLEYDMEVKSGNAEVWHMQPAKRAQVDNSIPKCI